MADEVASDGRAGVTRLLDAFDGTFRADRGAELADLFSDSGRLQWPEMEDFVGRDAIRAAFSRLTDTFHTLSWEASYQVFDVHGDRAYLLGRFAEVRQVRDIGIVERVPGRLVYICRREADGSWRFTHLLTSRHGETTEDAA